MHRDALGVASRRATRAAVCAFLAVCTGLASAQETALRFVAYAGDDERVAQLPVIEHKGVACIALPELVEQLGGGCRLLSGRVQVDMARQTAWLRETQTEVDGSLNHFSLLHPVTRQGDTVLMAVSEPG
mgnify:CR=1 FL=1